MRVAYVCADPGVPVFGRKGCSVHVQEVIRSLLDHGASIELFATRLGGDPPPGLDAVPIHQLPQVPKGQAAVRERLALSANHGLRTALTNTRAFDLIYGRHSLWSFAGMEYAGEYGIPGLLETISKGLLKPIFLIVDLHKESQDGETPRQDADNLERG